MRIVHRLALAGLAILVVTSPVRAASEGVQSRCYKCGLLFCFSFRYRTNAPRVMLRRWRSQVGVWRSRQFIVPNTHGRWSKWKYGGRSMSGYAYMEHYLKAGPHDLNSIASSRCSHY
jgi:hypothetical protein